jgi:hypothetical protein
MSTIKNKTAGVKGRKIDIHMEQFESAMEVAQTCKTRTITDSRFNDQSKIYFSNWKGVKSYDEALDLLRNGYQPTVDKMSGLFKATKNGEGKRFAFLNNVQGFAPVVPLALKNVPNCMIDMQMRPIKAKVIDVYYDMTASCGVDSDDIIKAGQTLLGAIIELEKQGYRFNLYAVQTYYDARDCDMLVVKIKSSGQPLDLKRISFPLTHTAFFRVVGFDWYSKVPGGKYRGGYGHALAYDYSNEQLQEIAHQAFSKTAVYFSAAKILDEEKEHVKEVLTNGYSKKG